MKTLETKLNDNQVERCVISFPESYLKSMKDELISILKNGDWKNAYRVAAELKRHNIDIKGEEIGKLATEYIFQSKEHLGHNDWIKMFDLDDRLNKIIKDYRTKHEVIKNDLMTLDKSNFEKFIQNNIDFPNRMKIAVELTFEGISLREKALTESALSKAEDILSRAGLVAKMANMDFEKLVFETEKMIINK
ncbi:MAG: hypothetical protein ACOZAR_01600 [Patescibacteria group bacterium]